VIDSHLHPLDEVRMFGHTIHGLIRGNISNRSVEVGGVRFALPASYDVGFAGDSGVLQVVRHPAAGPVDLAPEELASERALGRVWQNYAMVQRSGSLFGRNVGGWLYIHGNGTPWLIRPVISTAPAAGAPFTMGLNCRPFGRIGEAPVEPVVLTITCADIQQSTAGSRFYSLETVNNTGSLALMRLALPTAPDLPSGFLAINMTDDGELPAASLSVYKSQAQVRGTWSTTHPGVSNLNTLFAYRSLLPRAELQGAVYPDGPAVPKYPVGGGIVTATLVALEETDSERTNGFASYATFRRGDVEATSGRTGRIIRLQFDGDGVLHEFAYNTTYHYEGSMPAWVGAAAGQLTASGDGVAIMPPDWTETTPVVVSVSRTIRELISQTIELTQNGTPIASVHNQKAYSVNHTATLPPLSAGEHWAYAWVGGTQNVHGFGPARSNTTLTLPALVDGGASVEPSGATAEKGGPWPSTQAAAPATTSGVGTPQYASEMPVGTTQRDADSIGATFQGIGWSCSVAPAAAVVMEEVAAQRREIILAWPHAQLHLRDLERPNAVYHPVEHAIATDTNETDGIAVMFV